MSLTPWTLLATLVILPASARGFDLDLYAWEFPVVSAIPQDRVADLKSQLTAQIDDILPAGSVTP
jgi:hypothetical protein